MIGLNNKLKKSPKEILINAIKECAEKRKNRESHQIVLFKTNEGDFICIDEYMFLNTKKGYLKIECYSDDLTILSFEEFNIQEIWKIDMYDDIHNFDKHLYGNQMVWKRSEVIELTLDEIAKKFGIDVNNIHIIK